MSELAALNPSAGGEPFTAARLTSASARHRRRRRSDKRRDIQGLRAVAVIAVVVNHLVDKPKGGFVGVDVFFVISGFLITSLLLREESKSGEISLLGFYRRRIRRLLPAGLTVIVLTVIASHFAFISERAHSILNDGVWTALFAGNWHFLNVGTDYFQSYGPVSPLQHYWSLAVEEQFYAVWPLVLIVVMFLARRLFHGNRHAAVATGVVGALALTVPSMIYAAGQSISNPTAAYFSTFTRAWELGLGAVIAVVIPYMRGSAVVLSLLSWAGLGMIGASFFLVDQNHFPFPGALLPTSGAALVVLAKSPDERARNFLLTNKLSNYIGDISYSVYVVHFPVIVILGSLTIQHHHLSQAVVLVGTLGASMLLFHLIEDPIRNSTWLEPRAIKEKRIPRNATTARRNGAVLGAAAAVLALAMWVIGGISESPTNPYLAQVASVGTIPTAGGTGATGATAAPSTAGAATVPIGPNVAAVQADMVSALKATAWPKITPDFSHPADFDNHNCGWDTVNPVSQCTWGSPTAQHTLYLIGDSTSGAYLPAFVSFMKTVPNWKLVERSDAGCPFSTEPVSEDGGASVTAATQSCLDHNAKVVSEILAAKPDIAVFTSINGSTGRLTGKHDELAKIASSVGKLVILPAPPPTNNPASCDTAVSHPSDCITQLPESYGGWLKNFDTIATEMHGVVLDPTLLYCADGLCPVFVNTIPKTKDGVHMTVNYSEYVAPAVHELFQENNLLP